MLLGPKIAHLKKGTTWFLLPPKRWGDFSSKKHFKEGIYFYEGFIGRQGRVGGLRFFYGEQGVDMDIFI